jgi:hypothetical protein
MSPRPQYLVTTSLTKSQGIGTLWDRFDLIDTSNPPVVLYTGTEGNLGNEEIGRTGQRAFVEDEGGPGTAMSLWKEDPPLGYDR